MNREKPRTFERFRGKIRHVRPGQAPGTLLADPQAAKTEIRFFGCSLERSDDNFLERSVSDPEELPALVKQWPTSWIHVTGLGELETIGKLGEIFHLHRLALEDVINTNQRPKVEEFDETLFFAVRHNTWKKTLHSEQVAIFLGDGFVLSFQESENDAFEIVYDRLRKGKGRIRGSADYLAYALLDAIVDHNFPLLETYADRLEALEEKALKHPDDAIIEQVYTIKRDLATIRRAVWPLRDVFAFLLRGETNRFEEDTIPFLRDCHDHVLQVVDLVEHYREITSELVNVYVSGLSNRMNEVMRLLTLISTIFIPLGFIAGLYGMNFDPKVSPWNMPELSWRFGYPLVLALMAAVALAMGLVFLRKGWLGKNSTRGKRSSDTNGDEE